MRGKLKHGYYGTPTYRSWITMIQRTTNPNNNNYINYYGAKGIGVCSGWRDFRNFLADMGERPMGLTLERRDGTKGYCPENCYWASRKEQQNNLSNNRLLTVGDVTRNLAQWAELTGINRKTIENRIKLGWLPEHVVSLPARRGPSYKSRINT